SGLTLVLVVPPHPELVSTRFVSSLGGQVQIVIRGVDHVDSARVRRVRTENGSGRILVEDAGALSFRHAWILPREVVKRFLPRQFFRSERDVKIEIEI